VTGAKRKAVVIPDDISATEKIDPIIEKAMWQLI